MTQHVAAIAASFLPDSEIEHHSDLAGLRAGEEVPAAIVLGPQACSLETLIALRADARLQFLPVYVGEEAGSIWRMLTDGIWPGLAKALETRAEQLEREHRFLGGRPAETPDERLLCYFWMRPAAQLVPVVDPASDALYRYPLLEAFGEDTDPAHWLLTLLRRGWLEAEEIIDRIRRCQRCRSGHLNYVDVCPECASVDIQASESLHCFVCGHIGRQQTFTKEGALICPNCFSKLRHIGTDYDRPLETHSCNSCARAFTEPRVIARCLRCQREDEPAELEAVSVARYRLSEQTRLLAATGLVSTWTESLSALRLLPPDVFSLILSWQIDVVRRHESHHFSLVGVNLGDLTALAERIGEGRALQLLDSLTERLHQMIRSSDLVTRTLNDQLWLLLPATSGERVPTVVNRLRELESLTDEDVELRLRITSVSAPAELEPGEDAALLLARLGEAIR